MNLDDLWGSTITSFMLRLETQELVLRIQVEDGGEITQHDLRFVGVVDLTFVNGVRGDGPWAYAELSEIYVRREDDSGRLEIELLIWSGESQITGRCASIVLDGLRMPQDLDVLG